MKRLLLLLLPLLVSGCGYGSMFEADEACRAWKYKGGYIKQAIDTDDEPYWAIIRSCDDDVHEASSRIRHPRGTGRDDVHRKWHMDRYHLHKRERPRLRQTGDHQAVQVLRLQALKTKTIKD